MADRYYDFFQHSLNPQTRWQGPPAVHPLGIQPTTERWYSFAIDPVSFFIADTRTGRQEAGPGAHFFQEAQWQALEAWQRRLTGPGVLVLGQPLYQKRGDWRDHALLDFPEDYGRLCALIEDSHLGKNDAGMPHQILMLSGDIHTGRHAIRTIHGPDVAGAGFATERLREVHEFIASPASCIVPPFQGSREPELAPDVIRASHQGRRIHWSRPTNAQARAVEWTTLDNHVGYIHMTPGNDGRVRFSLWHFRIRPGPGPWWRGRGNEGDLQWIAGTDIELS